MSRTLKTLFIVFGGWLLPLIALADGEIAPPFSSGEVFIVTRAYNTPATHIRSEAFALDFTQNGCAAYGKLVLATESGVIKKANFENSSDPFGYYVLLEHKEGVQSRYAHLSNIVIATGSVKAGETIGNIGNTGNVSGSSCPAHKGTHLHFVMYKDGQAYRPEPMQSCTTVSSGATPCVNFAAGEWYRHDAIAVAEEQKKEPQFNIVRDESGSEIIVERPDNFFEGAWWTVRDGVKKVAGVATDAAKKVAGLFIDSNNEASIIAAITNIPAGGNDLSQSSSAFEIVPSKPPFANPRNTNENPPVVSPDANDTDIPDALDAGVSVNDDNDSDTGDDAAENQEAQNDESLNVQEVQDDKTSDVQEVQETPEDESSNVQEVQNPPPSFGPGAPYGPYGPGFLFPLGFDAMFNARAQDQNQNQEPYVLTLADDGWNAFNPILSAGESGFLMAWVETKFDSDLGNYLYRFRGRILDQIGTAQTPSFTIFAAEPGDTAASVTIGSSGNTFLAAWRHLFQNNSTRVLSVRINIEGEILDEDPIVLASSQSNTAVYEPSIASLPDGFFVVWGMQALPPAWGGDLVAKHIAADGTVIASFDLVTGQERNTPQNPYVVCGLFGERCFVSFYTQNGIRGFTVDPTTGSFTCGNARRCPILFRNGYLSNRHVAFDGQNYVIAWQDSVNGGVFARRISPTGSLYDVVPIELITKDTSEHPFLTPLLVFGKEILTAVFADVDPQALIGSMVAASLESDEEGMLVLGERQTISGAYEVVTMPNDAACIQENCTAIVQQGNELFVMPF